MARIADYRTVLEGSFAIEETGVKRIEFEMPPGFDQKLNSYMFWNLVSEDTNRAKDVRVLINPVFNNAGSEVISPPVSQPWRMRWLHPVVGSQHTRLGPMSLHPHGGKMNTLEFWLNSPWINVWRDKSGKPFKRGSIQVDAVFILAQVEA